MHGRRGQPLVIETQRQDFALARGRKTPGEISLEFPDEQRDALRPPPRMADREFDFGAQALRAVLVDDFDGVRIRADRAVA